MQKRQISETITLIKIRYNYHDYIFRFCNQVVGVNTLQVFMKTLSKELNLSQIYTNHDIRVTATTNLCRAGFSDVQVMAVTGHKSLASLALYRRVNNQEKNEMGHSLGK